MSVFTVHPKLVCALFLIAKNGPAEMCVRGDRAAKTAFGQLDHPIALDVINFNHELFLWRQHSAISGAYVH